MSGDSTDADFPDLVWTGSQFVVVWQDYLTEQLSSAVVNSSGLRTGPITSLTGADTNFFPAITWTGSEIGLVYYSGTAPDLYDFYFKRLDADGQEVMLDVRLTFGSYFWANRPGWVWNGSRFGLAYGSIEEEGEPIGAIHFLWVSGDGEDKGTDTRHTFFSNVSEEPSLAWTGSEFGILWHYWGDVWDVRPLFLTRIDADGNKLGEDTQVPVTMDEALSPSVVWTENVYGLTWIAEVESEYPLYFATMTSDGVTSDNELLLTPAPSSYDPTGMVWTGSHIGIAYLSEGSTWFTIIGLCD